MENVFRPSISVVITRDLLHAWLDEASICIPVQTGEARREGKRLRARLQRELWARDAH
jgi:hypothetical protein